jgi:hypothetical protein
MTFAPSAPVRLRLSRAKGFDLQVHSLRLNGLAAINCARPGGLGNPFVVGKHGTRAECVDLHRKLVVGGLFCMSLGKECSDAQLRHVGAIKVFGGHMRGKNLACWCVGAPCHVDTLLEVANQ